jgi:hypothetical protein
MLRLAMWSNSHADPQTIFSEGTMQFDRENYVVNSKFEMIFLLNSKGFEKFKCPHSTLLGSALWLAWFILCVNM